MQCSVGFLWSHLSRIQPQTKAAFIYQLARKVGLGFVDGFILALYETESKNYFILNLHLLSVSVPLFRDVRTNSSNILSIDSALALLRASLPANSVAAAARLCVRYGQRLFAETLVLLSSFFPCLRYGASIIVR